MYKKESKRTRREVVRLIVTGTALFFIIVFGVSYLNMAVPSYRARRIESCLSAGDTDGARRVVSRIRDDAQREEYLLRCNYVEAEALFAEGRYAEAGELYAAAGGYADSDEKAKRSGYLDAEEKLSNGDYDGAAAVFESLGGYSDAADRVLECRYNKAYTLEQSGSYEDAAELYESLGGYSDAEARLRNIAVIYTGIDDAEEALAVFRGLSREEREHLIEVARARDALPKYIIAVGFYHTVGLGEDGKVLACGSNDYGQCGTDALGKAVAVAAGAYHTVALHQDGTVSAVGRNSEKQCEVSDWRGVVQIAASDYATFALTSDGKLLCTGFYDYTEPLSWSGLDLVRGGSYNMAARRSDGTVWSFPALSGLEALSGCEALTINTGFAVGADNGGRVFSNAFDLSDWKDVIALSSSGTAILAIDADGRVLSHFFRPGDDPGFGDISGAVAIAAGGTHFAVVLSDGSVIVRGENAHGEGETSSWRLAVG